MKKYLFTFIIVSSLFCFVFGEATFDSEKYSYVENGTFTMGNNEGEDNEKPTHEVTLNYDFIIEKYEVTGKDFFEYLNNSDVTCDGKLGKVIVLSIGSKHHKINHNGTNFFVSISMEKEPATSITWYGCLYYCNWLSEKENLPVAYNEMGNLLDSNGIITDDITKVVGYRLPTEAEWEFAARGSSKNSNYAYSGSDDINEVAWYINNSNYSINMVGMKNPNYLGLFDMSGNVEEWCYDTFSEYSGNNELNPIGPAFGPNKIIRGGSFFSEDKDCTVSSRKYGMSDMSYSGNTLGFRVVRTILK